MLCIVSLSSFISVERLTDLKQTPYFVPKGSPVIGRISSEFGVRQHPMRHQRHFHKGIDIALPLFSKVVATASGKVSRVGFESGYGRLVVIDHGHGWETRYAHLQSSVVKNGDSVHAGVLIGRVGESGRTTGPHLHYEVLYQGKPQDPLHFIRAESEQSESLQLASSHRTASVLLR